MNWNWGKQPPGDGNIFISSTNQSGGITAHTVNIGPPKRVWTNEAGENLKSRVPLDAKVVIFGDGGAEGYDFACQIADWMRANGFTNVEGAHPAHTFPPARGQSLRKMEDGSFEITIGDRE